jgi:uncharacterized protein YbaP (TraB family)
MLRRISLVLASAWLLVTAATAAHKASAHPALWTVHGRHSTVYLLGSIHVLPPHLSWRDKRVEHAIQTANTYVFEVSPDADVAKQFIAEKGSLPPGQSLRAMLPPASQADLDADLASVNVPEANLDMRRPWLAELAMTTIQIMQSGSSPNSGVDLSLLAEVRARGKPVRFFETTEQQMALLAPDDPKLELESFEAFLKDFSAQKDLLPAMIKAWSAGDVKTLGELGLGHLAEHPAAKKALVDDRNRAWLKTIEAMLDHESGTLLITVGALHLTGDVGVPLLLRADGYKVDGP